MTSFDTSLATAINVGNPNKQAETLFGVQVPDPSIAFGPNGTSLKSVVKQLMEEFTAFEPGPA